MHFGRGGTRFRGCRRLKSEGDGQETHGGRDEGDDGNNSGGNGSDQ